MHEICVKSYVPRVMCFAVYTQDMYDLKMGIAEHIRMVEASTEVDGAMKRARHTTR